MYRNIIHNLTALQFYGALAGVRATELGLKEFNEIEKQSIDLLNKFQTRENPLSTELLSLATQLKAQREKYCQICRYNQIASDETLINVFRFNYEDFFSKGIVLSELQKVVDISVYLKEGYFLQTYRLTDVQAFNLRCAVAEFLESAQYFYNEAWNLYNEKKKFVVPTFEEFMSIPETERSQLPTEGAVQIRYFKEAFINLILFVESFVNGVAYDAYLQGIPRNPEEELNLKGSYSRKQQIHFISIKDKFKIIPKIINKGLTQAINTNDEPYKTYFTNFVELRNSYMHTSPAKGSTWFSAADWKNKNDSMIDKICFQVLEGFWNACYPNKPFPIYIKYIYYSIGFHGRDKIYFAKPI